MTGLVLEKATVRFDKVTVLEEFDFSVDAAGITAVMGPSGVGKTTLLRAIAGLLPLAAGQRRGDAKIAFVFQESRLLPWQNAIDNAALGLRAVGFSRPGGRDATWRILQRLGFSREDCFKHPHVLSSGMRQRVALARALATNPSLLLLDEPFSNLDGPLRFDLRQLLLGIVTERRIAAIMVTHDPVEAVLVADRLIVMGKTPARNHADLALPGRPRSWAEAYAAAATLMRRPEIVAAFARPQG